MAILGMIEITIQGMLIGADQGDLDGRQQRIGHEHQSAGDKAHGRAEAERDIGVEGAGARCHGRHLHDAARRDQHDDQAGEIDKGCGFAREWRRELWIEEGRDGRPHDRRGHDHRAGEADRVALELRRFCRSD
jgi:hypothetical protein